MVDCYNETSNFVMKISIYIGIFSNPSPNLTQVQAIPEQIRRKTYEFEVQRTISTTLLAMEKSLRTYDPFDLNGHDVYGAYKQGRLYKMDVMSTIFYWYYLFVYLLVLLLLLSSTSLFIYSSLSSFSLSVLFLVLPCSSLSKSSLFNHFLLPFILYCILFC